MDAAWQRLGINQSPVCHRKRAMNSGRLNKHIVPPIDQCREVPERLSRQENIERLILRLVSFIFWTAKGIFCVQ